jgi:alanine dehydrogenase
VEPVSSAEAAASDVDVLLSATNSRTPTISAEMVKPGMHIGVISVEEIGEDALSKMQILGAPQRLRLSANHWAIAEGSASHIHERSFEHGWWRNEALWERFVGLGDLIHDRGRGRRHATDATFFMAGGDGIQFAAVGAKVLEAAAAKGLGRTLPGDWFTQPYPS